MNLKLTLAAAVATGLMCSTAMAQPTHSPNPNKAQNSAMRTQSGLYPYALYPDGSPVPGHSFSGTLTRPVSPQAAVILPAPTVSEPMAGSRSIYVPTAPAPATEAAPSIEATPSVEATPSIEVTPQIEVAPAMERTSTQ